MDSPLLGSPPLTRGTLIGWICGCCIGGITPAYAGNTRRYPLCPLGIQDHPRLRGEHSMHSFVDRPFSGSPPLTRGTHFMKILSDLSNRITPAYAGNTDPGKPGPLFSSDHPRLRGEHLKVGFCCSRILGSPPLTRGTLAQNTATPPELRITPAYAGNTLSFGCLPSFL